MKHWERSAFFVKFPRQKTHTAIRGFSIVEILVVIGIIMILVGVAIPSIMSTLKEARARAAAEQVVSMMRRAHEIAIDRRHVVVLTFTPAGGGNPAKVTFLEEQRNVGPPVTFTPAPVVNTPNPETATLPTDMDFILPPTVPTTSPDALGTPTSATDFGYSPTVGGSGLNQMYFQADGTVLRDSPTGAVASGVIYMGRPNEQLASRAVSILGQTGRVKAWRMDTPGGTAKWIMQ
jgi:type II secretory pathway pseudopilin PulG